jgi:nucleoside-diphosphate-sugar epimerase
MVVWFLILLFRRWRRYYYFGDGLQTRSFQYVDDLVERDDPNDELEDGFLGPVNIGNPNEFTDA